MPFSAIVGHERIIDILQRSLTAKRISHAYLFHGPEGCGKRTTALTLVEAAFCNGFDGCGVCPNCKRVAELQHPDLQMLEPDGAFIKIDQVRDIQRKLSLKPYEAPFKVCIIEAADRFHQAAGNALLKTLEEPPGNALMILLTSNPDGVLPTIRSRCQPIRFPSLPEKRVENFLIAKGNSDETARLAASLANGSIGKALNLCSSEELNDRRELIEQIFSLSLKEIGPLFSTSERLSSDKERTPALLDLLTTFLRDILLIQEGCDDITNRDLLELIRNESLRHTPERVMELINHVSAARQALNRNVNTRLTLDMLFMRLAA